MLLRLATTSALTLIFSVLPAHAETSDRNDFKIFLGAGAFSAPDYLGSTDSGFAFSPDVEVTYQDHAFLSSRDGAGFYLFNTPSVLLGVSVSPEWGRDEGANSHLTGLGDIKPGAWFNIFADVPFEPFVFHAGMQQEFAGSHGGMLLNAALSFTQPLTEKATVTLTPSTTWADSNYMVNYYGVTAAQSISSGLPVKPIGGGGMRDVSLDGRVNYALTPNWGIYGDARYTRLLGDAASSPITLDKDQLFVGAGLGWRWPAHAVPNAHANTNLPVR